MIWRISLVAYHLQTEAADTQIVVPRIVGDDMLVHDIFVDDIT